MEEKYDIHDFIEEEQYRYVLGKTVTKENKNTILCLGVNPSTAKSDKTDLTMRVIEEFLSNKYGRFIMMNLTPERNPKVDKLNQNMNQKALNKNLENIAEYVKKYQITDILCAWGNAIDQRKEYLYSNLELIYNTIKKENKNCKFYCFGKTKCKNPKHPRWIQYQTKADRKVIELEDFNIEEYIKYKNQQKEIS